MKNRSKQLTAMLLALVMTAQGGLSLVTPNTVLADDAMPAAAEEIMEAAAENSAPAPEAVIEESAPVVETAVEISEPAAEVPADVLESSDDSEAVEAEAVSEAAASEDVESEAADSESEDAEAESEDVEADSDLDSESESEEAADEAEADSEEEVKAAETVIFRGSANGVTVVVTDDNGAFPEGTTMKVTAVKASAVFETIEQAVDGALKAVKAVDITFYNTDGIEIEPEGPVTLSMKADGFAEDNTQHIVHIDDSNNAEVMAVCDAETSPAVSGKAVASAEFETEAFSIYAITDENGEVIVPRATYHFCDENGKALSAVADQVIKNGESLRAVSAPAYDNKAFLGWFIYDGSWGEEVSFGTAIQVLFGQEKAIYGNSVVVPHTSENDKTDHIDVTVRARYTTNYGTVYFLQPSVTSISYTDANIVKTTVKAGIGDGATTTAYAIPDVTELSVSSGDASYEFVGWSESAPKKSGSSYQYYSSSDNRTTVSEITVTKNRASVLYPVFKKAHWLIFKTAPAGMGADYTAPAYVANTSKASTKEPADPSLRGFRFRYWTTTPTFSEETGEFYTFEEGAEPAAYNFNQYLTENVTLYAFWESGYSTYTVIFWKQRVSDDKNAQPGERTYEFAEQVTREARVGAIVNPTAADLNRGAASDSGADYTGFHHKSEQNTAGDRHVDSSNVMVASSGASVINVYYDRDLVTMRFYNGKGSAPSGGYDSSVWTKASADLTVYTGLYGQSLADNGYTWPSGSWSYYNDTNGTTGMSYLGSFVLPDGTHDPEGREIRLYYSGSIQITIEFFLQNPDGTYNSTPTDKGYVSTAGTFYFSEKYDGFTLDEYRRYTVSGSKKTYYNASGKSQTNADNAWAAAADGGSTPLSESSWFSSRTYNLEIRYARKTFAVFFLDGTDGKALTVRTTGGATTQKHEGILYGAPLSQIYPAADFEPAVSHTGSSFNGRWYGDRSQSIQVFFHASGRKELTEAETKGLWYYVDASGEKIYTNAIPTAEQLEMTIAENGRKYSQDAYTVYTEMPMHDLPLYAGFSKDWYWVKIDPNGGELADGDSTYFWEEYGGIVSEYNVTRSYVRSSEGSYYYHYAEFNEADPDGDQPSPRTAYYTTDRSESTDGQAYRLAGEDEGYAFAGWYQVNADGSLTPYNFDTLVTDNLTLQAQWSRRGSFRICYSLASAVDRNGNPLGGVSVRAGETAPEDTFKYAENATVVVKSGVVESDNDAYRFAGWYFGNSVLTAGDVFTANTLLAEKHPEAEGDAAYDTFILYPVFVLKDGNDSSDDDVVTRLVLDANGGEAVTGFTAPAGAALNSAGTQLTLSWTNLKVNEAVTIPSGEIFEKANAEFLGWAFSRNAKTPAFTAGQTVGVDNLAGSGYSGDNTNTLYAVWRMTSVKLKIRKVAAGTSAPLAGAVFSMDLGGETITLTSGEDGYLVYEGEKVISVNAPRQKNYENVYKLTELLTPDGYDGLKGDVEIKVTYDGTVTYRQENGAEQQAVLSGGVNGIVVTNKLMPAPTDFQSNGKPFGFLLLFGVLLALLPLASRKFRSARECAADRRERRN